MRSDKVSALFSALPLSSYSLFVRYKTADGWRIIGDLQEKSSLFGSGGHFLQRDGSYERSEELIAGTNSSMYSSH